VFNLLFGGDNSSASDGFHWGLPEAGDDGELKKKKEEEIPQPN